MSTELERRVDKIEKRADHVSRIEDIENRVVESRGELEDLYYTLSTLEDEIVEARHYAHVFVEVFDGDRPVSLDDAVQKADEVVSISEDELVKAAENRNLRDIEKDAEDAIENLEEVNEEIENDIQNIQRYWKDKIETAKELNSITEGVDSEFKNILRRMEDFFEDIWDTSEDPEMLADRWGRLEQNWKENEGKHGWEDFKQKHGLSQDSLEVLKRFSESEKIYLNEVSTESLEELKNVTKLATSLAIEIDT
ncbi:MAG: hypothetical protein ABEJ83_04830 [Candidatus Nanohaloarchaea archaeon]